VVNTLYLAKRIFISIVSVFIVASVVFGMTMALPGSAANIVLGQRQTEEAVAEVEQDLGLDRPLHEQYIDFLTNTATLDFGESLVSGEPVMSLLVPALQRTLELALVAMLLSIVVAIPLGVITASKRDSWLDKMTLNISYVTVSVPSFVSATVLLLFLTSPPLDLFPSGGHEPFMEGPVTWLHHLILPAIAINFVVLTYVLRQTRSSMIETLESDYIRTARLKGVSERNVLLRHALRNGLLPAVTVLALNFGWMMGAVVIIEEIFTYPGIGRLIVRSISSRDLPVIQAAVLVPTVAFIFANLLADIIYTLLDPRVSLGEK
jgi:peptide/nickel transport system permease protein